LVKVPPTSREAPEERVKLFALLIVVFPVEVAFSVIDQPPVVESKVRWWKVEEPGATVSPVSAELKITVPALLLKVPEVLVSDPPIERVPEGNVRAPCSR
jgi:hypothetical protein